MRQGENYDLEYCLEYNPQGFVLDDIAEVLAVWTGENDGENWRWVLRLEDGRFVFLTGGCDYTGWDCRSWATSTYATTAKLAINEEKLTSVADALRAQLKYGKLMTWAEQNRWEGEYIDLGRRYKGEV